MRILPAVAESDFDTYADAISDLQQTIGEYFAPVQGGVFASPAVARALEAVAAEQKAGIGQTSWGPVGFAFVASAQDAERALARRAARLARRAAHVHHRRGTQSRRDDGARPIIVITARTLA